MKLNLLCFGIAREILGGDAQKMEFPDSKTIGDLKIFLNEHYPELNKLAHYMVAKNNQYAADIDLVADNDEIAIIPPVSGG